jgi:hypothetical protein
MDNTMSNMNEDDLKNQIAENSKLIDQFLTELKNSKLWLSLSEKAIE